MFGLSTVTKGPWANGTGQEVAQEDKQCQKPLLLYTYRQAVALTALERDLSSGRKGSFGANVSRCDNEHKCFSSPLKPPAVGFLYQVVCDDKPLSIMEELVAGGFYTNHFSSHTLHSFPDKTSDKHWWFCSAQSLFHSQTSTMYFSKHSFTHILSCILLEGFNFCFKCRTI